MNIPICQSDLRSGILCLRHPKELDSGVFSLLDLEMMKTLLDLENRIPNLKDVTYVKSAQTTGLAALLLSGQNLPSNMWGRIGSELRKKLNVNLRVIEKAPSLKRLVEQIIAPVRVVGVNTIWIPDGSRESSVIIDRGDVNRLPSSPENIEKIVYELSHEVIRIRPR